MSNKKTSKCLKSNLMNLLFFFIDKIIVTRGFINEAHYKITEFNLT